MTHVVVVLSNPAAPAVDQGVVARLSQAIDSAGVRTLSDGVAVELTLADPALGMVEARKALADRLRPLVEDRPIDIAVLPAAGRRKRLLVADMDSTMIRQECIDELAAELGLKDKIAAITARAMRGEIAFEPALRERVGLLAGLPASVVDKVIAERIDLMPGGPALIATMRANGAYTALVSGGFTVFTGPISRRLGFDEHRSNILEVEDGRLAGRVREPILGQQAKLDSLVELRERFGLAEADTLAVGDGANDLAMIGAAGLGVALHAKPKVAEAAEVRIDHGDLTALLYLQGYSDSDFASG